MRPREQHTDRSVWTVSREARCVSKRSLNIRSRLSRFSERQRCPQPVGAVVSLSSLQSLGRGTLQVSCHRSGQPAGRLVTNVRNSICRQFTCTSHVYIFLKMGPLPPTPPNYASFLSDGDRDKVPIHTSWAELGCGDAGSCFLSPGLKVMPLAPS